MESDDEEDEEVRLEEMKRKKCDAFLPVKL